ncbi:hypothetical protein pb186bvf_018622 [Paramecium bursaria]
MKKFSHSSEKYVPKYPNYEFHNKLATEQKNVNEIDPRIVQHIINWRKYDSQKQWKLFYDDLEYDHAFIQWIFPNFFKSMFNYNSYRLNIDELIKMKESPEIMALLKENTKMIEKFLGIYDDQHGRFKDCVVRDTHNRLRIRRILACLKVFNLKEECDNFLKTMVEKLEQQKNPKNFQQVIELFRQYEDIISPKNVNLYFQEDIKYEKDEMDKVINYFNLMDVEKPFPDSNDQNSVHQNSNKHKQQQQNKDEIQLENNEIILNEKSRGDQEQIQNNEQQQDLKQEGQKAIKQKEQNSSQIMREKGINMVQPRQVGQNDDFPMEEEEIEKQEVNQPQQKELNKDDNKDHTIDPPQIQLEPKQVQKIDIEPKL